MPKNQKLKKLEGGDLQLQRTLVLSDLHLGRVTTYAHAPEVIAPLVEGFDRVLLLGDIIDYWYTRPQQAAALEARIRAVCKAAGVKEVLYFRGNHDACAETAEDFALIDGILYLHGHAVYHALHGDGCATTRIKALNDKKFGPKMSASRIDRHIWTVIDRVYGRIPMALLSPIAWPWPVMKRIEALVKEVAPQGGVQGVVLGHTHRPGVKTFNNLKMFNLGGWMKNTRAYGFVRDKHNVSLIHIENRQKQLRWGEVLHQSELEFPVLVAQDQPARTSKSKIQVR
jgi:UDP-2,3-diacylglucosamine pyrophosphatase LpxH